MCSYCGCESLTVIGAFMAEHVDIVNATTALRQARERQDRPAAGVAAAQLVTLLGPHAQREEVGLFRVLARQDEFEPAIASLCAEHTMLEAHLAAIVAGDLGVVDPLIAALRDHIHREENGLFPATAIALSGADWAEVEAATPPEQPPE